MVYFTCILIIWYMSHVYLTYGIFQIFTRDIFYIHLRYISHTDTCDIFHIPTLMIYFAYTYGMCNEPIHTIYFTFLHIYFGYTYGMFNVQTHAIYFTYIRRQIHTHVRIICMDMPLCSLGWSVKLCSQLRSLVRQSTKQSVSQPDSQSTKQSQPVIHTFN